MASICLPLLLATALAACSLAQRPSPRPTIPPPPTLAPDATPLPTPVPPCSRPPELPAGGGIVELEDFPLAGALEVTDVTWTGSRFVAVGVAPLASTDFGGPRQGIVWTSCDGVEWQELVDPALQYVTPMSVAAIGADTFILGILSVCGAEAEEGCEDVAEAGNGRL
jgi:hypothetical protein